MTMEEARIRRNEMKRERRRKDSEMGIPRRRSPNEEANRRRHGLTAAEREALISAQGGLCAACGCAPKARRDGKTPFAVDHDHSCCPGRYSCGYCIRGLICLNCNSAIGMAGDDASLLVLLADYLDDHSRLDQQGVQ